MEFPAIINLNLFPILRVLGGIFNFFPKFYAVSDLGLHCFLAMSYKKNPGLFGLKYLLCLSSSILEGLKSMSELGFPQFNFINRRSYMSARVLLNLLNELRKSDQMRGLTSILFLFCNKFNKFNDTETRMLDSIYHMMKTLKLIKNHIFGVKTSIFCHLLCNSMMDVLTFSKNL